MRTVGTLSNSIAECETVAIDLDETHFDLDFSGLFSQPENKLILKKLNMARISVSYITIKSGVGS
jgi:hypothetical protein